MEGYVDISKYRQLTFDKLRTRERIADDLEGSSVLLMILKEIILKRNQKMFRTSLQECINLDAHRTNMLST